MDETTNWHLVEALQVKKAPSRKGKNMKNKPFILGDNNETKELFKQLKKLPKPAIKEVLVPKKLYKKLKKLSTFTS